MFSSPTIAPKRQTIADIYCVFFPVAFFRFGNFCLKFCRASLYGAVNASKSDENSPDEDFIDPQRPSQDSLNFTRFKRI